MTQSWAMCPQAKKPPASKAHLQSPREGQGSWDTSGPGETSLLPKPSLVPGDAALGHTAHGRLVLSAAIHPQRGCMRSKEAALARWTCRVELGPLLWGAGSTQLEGEGSLLGLMPSLAV